MKKLMQEAHKMTREIKAKYPEVDYKFQLGLCMSYLLNKKEEETMMTTEELNGHEIITESLAGWNYKVRLNLWEKGNMKRLYINEVNAKREQVSTWSPKESRKSLGFIDLKNKTVNISDNILGEAVLEEIKRISDIV